MKRLFLLVLMACPLVADQYRLGFDEEFAVGVTQYTGTIDGLWHNWRAMCRIQLDNGLFAIQTWDVKDSSSANLLARATYTKKVNLVGGWFSDGSSIICYTSQILLVQEGDIEGFSYPIKVDLYVEPDCSLDCFPKVLSIVEISHRVDSGWLFDSHYYRYAIMLSDGTTYLTPERSHPISSNRWIDKRVMKGGAKTGRCLFNIDLALERENKEVLDWICLE